MKAQTTSTGLIYGATAFFLWGVFPFYFKALKHVPSNEILAHRIVWSFIFLGIVVLCSVRLTQIRQALTSLPLIGLLTLTSILLACNWLTYIWAINNGFLLQGSLGYFLSPLVTLVFAKLFFKERIRPPQKVAVLLAALAVLALCLWHGTFPWIAVTLAFTFSLYGTLRKVSKIDSLPGLFLETSILVIPTLAFLFFLESNANLAFLHAGALTTTLLLIAGIITSIPLLFFVGATRRLDLVTVSFLQYITPLLQFAIAVFLFQEPFVPVQMLAFCLIWAGLLVFAVDARRAARTST